ncbi:undecaprenyl-diphosphate phosphatase [Candidatus Peregrinibacteria bacterium]|nr:MAG: undecaprenyl-diphosphate phosphatase [Candidatus Peregrinibacteria bacterium]
MTTWEVLFLGMFQGITEFLPISSSGHLALAEHFFGLPAERLLAFDVVLHGGTLLSLLILFWRDLWEMLFTTKKTSSKEIHGKNLLLLLFLASIPAGLLGVFAKDFFESMRSPMVIGYGFLFSGICFLLAEKIPRKKYPSLSFFAGMVAGVFQAFAPFAGVSRSGITTAGAMFAGVERATATRFSFFLGIPILSGALLLQLISLFSGKSDFPFSFFVVSIGFITSALIGYAIAKYLLKFFQEYSLYPFAYYLLGTGALLVVFRW